MADDEKIIPVKVKFKTAIKKIYQDKEKVCKLYLALYSCAPRTSAPKTSLNRCIRHLNLVLCSEGKRKNNEKNLFILKC